MKLLWHTADTGLDAPSLQEDREDIRREVQVLNLVSDHPHVAELIEVFEDAKAIHLVLELCKGGELFDRVVSKGTFTERMAAGLPLFCCCPPLPMPLNSRMAPTPQTWHCRPPSWAFLGLSQSLAG